MPSLIFYSAGIYMSLYFDTLSWAGRWLSPGT